jgi:ADP-heptose:LPS heptosyltransferase
MILPDNISKILVIEVSGIGDIVMSIPAFRALREKYPQACIVALISSRVYPLLKGCPYIDEVYMFEIGNFKFSWDMPNISGIFNSLGVILRLRVKKFDLVINLYQIASFWGNLRMKMLFKVISPRLSVGRETQGKGEFYNLKLKSSLIEEVHEVEKKLELMNLVGASCDDKRLELWPDNEAESRAVQILDEFGIKEGDYLVGISPNSLQRGNLWLDERFAELADNLVVVYNAKIVFFGTFQEKRRVGKIIAFMKHKPINLIGRLSLAKYICVLKRLKVFITLDSGPMHIASVYKIPTIVLSGSASSNKFGPYNNEKAIIVHKKVVCSPCYQPNKCKNNICMDAIHVSDVLDAFKELRIVRSE